MKLSVTSLFLAFSFLTFGQVPNYEFEDWANDGPKKSQEWNTIGHVTESTDASEGNKAIKLNNVPGFDGVQFGAATNAIIGEGITGGVPYTDIPLVFRFDAKYDLDPGDAARILVIFKLQGQSLGTVDFAINGTSADTFATFKVPVQWAVSTAPDSIIVILSSADFENEQVNGEGHIIYDNISFESIGTPDDNIPGASFEMWEDSPISAPVGWTTTDEILAILSSQNIAFNSVIETSESHHGKGLLLQNISFDEDDIVPGIAITGNNVDLDDEFPPTFPVSAKQTFLQGYYKYESVDGDNGQILVNMYNNGTVIGAGVFPITKSTEQLAYFSTPITYLGSGNPDSATIVIVSADIDNAKSEDTKLWIDKLSFTNTPATINSLDKEQVTIYPNPATDQVYLEHEKPIVKIEIYNLVGELISTHEEGLNQSTVLLPIFVLEPNTYIVKAYTTTEVYSSLFIKL